MKNSKAYKYLMKQINATGSKKLDGYYPKIMEEIYDWERDEVEDVIWNTFHKNKDTDLAMFLPKLKKYDGIKALKEMLAKCNIPSANSLNIAEVLLEYTGDERYLEVFRKNIFNSKGMDNVEAVSRLSHCTPSDQIYEILVEVYLNTKNDIVLSTAVTGLLYNKGYINDPRDLKELTKRVKLGRGFLVESIEERRRMIRKLESGELE